MSNISIFLIFFIWEKKSSIACKNVFASAKQLPVLRLGSSHCSNHQSTSQLHNNSASKSKRKCRHYRENIKIHGSRIELEIKMVWCACCSLCGLMVLVLSLHITQRFWKMSINVFFMNSGRGKLVSNLTFI